MMEQQIKERVELYGNVPLRGDPIPINVEPFDTNGVTLDDGELREVVKSSYKGRAGKVRGM